MSYFALNLLLAIVYMLLLGSFEFSTFLFGFALGYAVLFLFREPLRSSRYARAGWGVLRFVEIYFYELFLASVHLARDVLRREMPFKSGIVRFDARALSPPATALLSNLLSLTPGSVTVDAEDDGSYLYIHTVYAHDPERVRKSIQLYADLILGVTGAASPPSEEELDQWRPT